MRGAGRHGTAGLTLEAGSAVPGEQIENQLVDLVSTGALTAGYRRPSVRGLAERLGVASGTVAKAYRALEQKGYLVTAGRNGTQVADQRVATTARTRQQLQAVLQPLLDEGMSTADVLQLVRSVLACTWTVRHPESPERREIAMRLTEMTIIPIASEPMNTASARAGGRDRNPYRAIAKTSAYKSTEA